MNQPSQTDAGPAVRVAAVGDLLLACEPEVYAGRRDLPPVREGLAETLGAYDLVLGNLECTLPGTGETVPTVPHVIAPPGLVRETLAAGNFTAVALANNHAFDCFDAGFEATRTMLRDLGIAYFGAGANLEEALAPAIVDRGGVRVGFLGAVDARSGPARFATADASGVAPLEVHRLAEAIRALRERVDHVVASVHWGEERLLVPSPALIDAAHALAEAGASLILGHHPHVIQGMETHGGVPIVYSLGNFIAHEVPFPGGERLTWRPFERAGCLLEAELTPSAVRTVRQVAVYDDGRRVGPDPTGVGGRRIVRTNRALSRGVTLGRYRRAYLWAKTLRPALERLRWSKLKRLRLRNLRNALSLLWRAGKAD